MRKQYKEIKDAYMIRQKEEIKIFEEIENKIKIKENNKNENIIKKCYNLIIDEESKEKTLKKIPTQICLLSKMDKLETKETDTEIDSSRNLILLAKIPAPLVIKSVAITIFVATTDNTT